MFVSVCEFPQCIRLCGLCECEYLVPARMQIQRMDCLRVRLDASVSVSVSGVRDLICVCVCVGVVFVARAVCVCAPVHEGLPGQGQSQGSLTVTYEVPLCARVRHCKLVLRGCCWGKGQKCTNGQMV